MSKPTRKLTHGELHLLTLVRQDSKPDGWTPVSKIVMTVMAKLPPELVIVKSHEDGRGRAKLTDEGKSVLDARYWLP